MSIPSADADTPQLLQLARSGNVAALGQLLAIYRSHLVLLARTQIGRRLQGKADASDLVQDAVLEAHRHFNQFRGETQAEFAAWLRSILASLIANHVRRFLGTKARDARLERQLAAELDTTSHHLSRSLAALNSSPSHQVARREASLMLSDALDKLPAAYREVILLRHIEGLAFAEVAERMQRSVDSVQKLWVRALARLREGLEESSD